MRVALLALLAVGLVHDTADACTCGGPEIFVPARDATDVPTNTRELVFTDWYYGTGVEYQLRDDSGTPIELGPPVSEPGYDSSVLRVPIVGTLAANTAYELSRGGDLTPYPFMFTTGAGTDTTAPAAVTVTGLAVDYAWDEGSSCGEDASRFRGMVTSFEATGSLMVRLTGPAVDTTRSLLASEYALWGLGGQTCSVSANVRPCKDYSLSIWQRDVAGNEGPVATYDFHVRGCPRIDGTGGGSCDDYTGPDLCNQSDYDEYEASDGDDIPPLPDDDGGCATGGASPLALLALIALRRTSRASSRTRSPRA